MRRLEVRDLRNISRAAVELHPGLNVFSGCNAQGKTSLLEAVGLVARGRSFRTEDTSSLIRRGSAVLSARAEAWEGDNVSALEVSVDASRRSFVLNGRAVPPREYHGRLEVVVYSTDRLRVVRGSMRDRRLFLDRAAAAVWPSYRADLRAFDRVLAQRNAALQQRRHDEEVWTERFVATATRLRRRRAEYATRLSAALAPGFRPCGEAYAVTLPAPGASEAEQREAMQAEIRAVQNRERLAGRSLAGPHRDPVGLTVDGRDVADGVSSGQARSLLLALALASLQVYREETGHSAVALLDDLDSELDADRARGLCEAVTSRGQALVTSAHPAWAESLRSLGQVYHVSGGAVRAA